MGRPELPVDFTVPARGELATELRTLRTGARLTYDELAVKSGLSPATLKRAASGRILPSQETVTAIAVACGGDPAAFRARWLACRIADRRAERDRLGRERLRRPGAPELLTTRGSLSEAMEHFYEMAGAPSLRKLHERAGESYLLPVSSAARIISREALPASRQQCEAFLIACGVGPGLVERWGQAFDRITRSRDADAATEAGIELAWEDDGTIRWSTALKEHRIRSKGWPSLVSTARSSGRRLRARQAAARVEMRQLRAG